MIKLPGYTLNEEVSRSLHSLLYKGTRKEDNLPVLIETYPTVGNTAVRVVLFKQAFSIINDLISENFIIAYNVEDYTDGLAFVYRNTTL